MAREGTASLPGQNRIPGATGIEEASGGRWLLCRAGAVLCALPIEHVIEIMRLLPIERIAGAPEYVLGLSAIRGAPVPVVDLGRIVSGQISHSARLITVRAATRTIALAVTAVIRIGAIAVDAFGQLPPLLHDTATDTVAAIAASDGELIIFLRAARLVPEDLLALLDADGETA
jgi:purine-binding chemotaxis protein CheW